MASGVLSGDQCRMISDQHGNPKRSEGVCASPGPAWLHALRDPHVESSEGRQEYGVGSLARVLRNRRLLFIGDSTTRQYAEALQCEANRTLRGGIEPVSVSLQSPRLVELEAQCQRLTKTRDKLHNAKDKESRARLRKINYILVHVAWPCRLRRRTQLTLNGWHSRAFNFTWFPGIGPQMNLYQPAGGAGHAVSGELEEPEGAWPSRLQLAAEHDLADVALVGFGLHYTNEETLRDALRTALAELEDFARRRPGRLAVIREVSTQHFAADDGTYEGARARNLSLVQQTNGNKVPMKPCLPLRRRDAARASWRTRIVRQEVGAVRQTNRSVVMLLPFEKRTQLRWDYHVARKSIFTGIGHDGVKHYVYDCTHLCYSPHFWQAALDDLARTLKLGPSPFLPPASARPHSVPHAALPAGV
jgi:hypothetical protein